MTTGSILSHGASLLKRMVGRIRQMKVMRGLILVLFVFVFNIIFPAINDFIQPTAKTTLRSSYTFVLAIILLVSGVAALLLFLIWRIDRIEDKREDERLEKFFRRQQQQLSSEHFDSIL